MDYKKAIEYIIKRRQDDLFNAGRLFSDALINNGELERVEKQLRELTLLNIRGESTDAALFSALSEKKAALLAAAGLTEAVLNPPPRCKLCSDTGLKGGNICICVKSIAFKDKDNLKIPLHDFSEADFSLYGEGNAAANGRIFADVAKIATLYPQNKKRIVTLMGATGTGKTFLAGCAANLLMERGHSVVAVTAFDFLNRALKYHTTFNESKLAAITPLLECSLLIIDDLGTESILKNVTLEYLYLILSERTNNDCLTLLTTNLDSSGLLSRYGERIYSRLFSKALAYAGVLTGKDLRINAV